MSIGATPVQAKSLGRWTAPGFGMASLLKKGKLTCYAFSGGSMNRRALLKNAVQLGVVFKFAPLIAFAQPMQDYRKWIVIDALCSVNTEDTTIKPEILKQAL